MDNVKRSTEELAAAIRNSDACAVFEEKKRALQEHPGLYAKVNQFRRHNYQLQNQKGDIDWLQKLGEFDQEYEEFRKEPLVEEFLKAELEMCRMIQRINETVADSVDLDIEDFTDIIEW